MPDLNYEIKHLKGDVKHIHDNLEHLNSHSKVCNDLIKESNLREASELFSHLEQIDKQIHEVHKHIDHINEHIEQDQLDAEAQEIIDIDDLKHDAKHTSIDLKDIHTHIEHLITHADMCQDIMAPKAEEELLEIKQHLTQIDDKAHELLDHVKSIRGGISTKYPEFIWSVPDGLDEYLNATELIDSDETEIKDPALILVDGAESVQFALKGIIYYTRDFISPIQPNEKHQYKASNTLVSHKGGGIARSILACALARAVKIPSRIHFWRVSVDAWMNDDMLKEIVEPKNDICIASPEFYINDDWETVYSITGQDKNITNFHNKFIELGIPKPDVELDGQFWKVLPLSYLKDDGKYAEPSHYLNDPRFTKPPKKIDSRLFSGFVYTGNL